MSFSDSSRRTSRRTPRAPGRSLPCGPAAFAPVAIVLALASPPAGAQPADEAPRAGTDAVPAEPPGIVGATPTAAGSVGADLAGLFAPAPMYRSGIAAVLANPPGAAERAAIGDAAVRDLEAFARLSDDFRRYVDGFVLNWHRRRERDVQRSFRRNSAVELDLQRRSRRAAIHYIERFLDDHVDVRPYTPEAMYRLGDLYWEDENERAATENRSRRFLKTIDTYRNLLTRYPDFDKRDGVHYVLGFSLQETASDAFLADDIAVSLASPIDPNQEEAVAVFLAFACANKVSYPAFRGAIAGPHRVAGVAPEWFAPPPPPPPPSARAGRRAPPLPPAEEYRDLADPDTVLRDYFKDCRPRTAGSRFVAPTWFVLGKHFNGRYGKDYDDENVEWAISAYRRVVDLGPERNAYFAFALAEIGHNLSSMNRFDQAIEPYRTFLDMLEAGRFGEYQSKAQGQKRNVLIGVAANLIYDNWTGPRAAQSAAERAADPALVPQNAEWFRPLMETLVDECCEQDRCDQWAEKAGVYRLFIQRFPTHPRIPALLRKLVDLYRENPDDAGRSRQGMLEAIECLALFRQRGGQQAVPDAAASPLARNTLCPDPTIGRRWWDENRDNPELVQEAEEQAEGALQDAAGQYHAAALVHQANCDAGQAESCRLAPGMFDLAAQSYRQVLREYPSSTYTYDNMFNLAECLYLLGRTDEALAQYSEVERSPLATHHQRNALFNQIVLLGNEFANRGQGLIPDRPPTREEAEGRTVAVPVNPIPSLVTQWQGAMTRWMERYPTDPENLNYRRRIASQMYFLGHWDRAEAEYRRLLDEQCGSPTGTEIAIDAWQTLRTLAQFAGDRARLDALDAEAESRGCFEGGRGQDIRQGIQVERIRGAFRAGSERFMQAQEGNDPAAYREAARMLLEVVAQHPTNEETAKAIRMAAVAYGRANEPVRAVETWKLLIRHCGDQRYAAQCRDVRDPAARISLPEAYFYVGINAMTTFDLEEARTNFEGLDRAAGTPARGQRLRPVPECIADARRPCTDAEFKADAVRAIADTYRLQGRYAQAARFTERVIAEGYTRSEEEASRMRFEIVRYYREASEWSEMRRAAGEYLRQYENAAARRLDVLRVVFYMYEDAERQRGRGGPNREMPNLERAFGRLSAAEKGIAGANLTAAQAQLVIQTQETLAKVRFEALESKFREFDRYDFQYRGFRTLSEDIRTFGANIIRSAKDLTAGYLAIVRDFPVSPTYGVAARYRIGYIWNRWYGRWAKLQEKLPPAALSDATLNMLDELVAGLRGQEVDAGITVDNMIRFTLIGDGSPASKGITGAVPYARATGSTGEWVRAAIELVRQLNLSGDPSQLFANGRIPAVAGQALGEGLDPLAQ